MDLNLFPDSLDLDRASRSETEPVLSKAVRVGRYQGRARCGQGFHDVHGAFDVSEQDGDDFAFAFEGGPAREDTVGKVRGSVDDWSGVRSPKSRRVERLESRVWGLRRRGWCDQGGATFSTKLL